MKNLRLITLMFALFALGTLITACGSEANSGSQETTENEAAAHGDGPEYTSAYVCPMHCAGSGSDEPGQCPVCGMDYVAKHDHTDDGHSHQ